MATKKTQRKTPFRSHSPLAGSNPIGMEFKAPKVTTEKSYEILADFLSKFKKVADPLRGTSASDAPKPFDPEALKKVSGTWNKEDWHGDVRPFNPEELKRAAGVRESWLDEPSNYTWRQVQDLQVRKDEAEVARNSGQREKIEQAYKAGYADGRGVPPNDGEFDYGYGQDRPKQEPYSVNIAVPSIRADKMKAISDLCQAVKALAHTLNSVCMEIVISNNVITCQPGGTGINIQPEEAE